LSFNKPKIENINQFERGYLLGLFLGDGYSFYSPKDRHYRVEFYLNSKTDKDIIEYTKGIIKKLNLNYFLMKDKRFYCLKIAANSKSFREFIKGNFKKLEGVYNFNKIFKSGIICGFIDAEGCTKNGGISVSQRDKKRMGIIIDLCESLGINDLRLKRYKNPKTTKPIYRLRISTRFKYMLLDSCKVKRMAGVNLCSS